MEINKEIERIKSIPPKIWNKISEWGSVTNLLTIRQRDIAFNLAGRIRNNSKISDNERNGGLEIMDIVINKAPELLEEIDNINEQAEKEKSNKTEINIDLIKKIIEWDKEHKKLKGFEFLFMKELLSGKKPLSEHNKNIAKLNYEKAKKYGFKV